MFLEYWSKWWCGNCKVANWMYIGDISDTTQPDAEAVQCWSCRSKFWLDEEESKYYYMSQIEDGKTMQELLEEVYVEFGKISPNEGFV